MTLEELQNEIGGSAQTQESTGSGVKFADLLETSGLSPEEYEPAVPRIERGVIGEAGAGVQRGLETTAATGLGFIGLLGNLVGSESVETYGIQGYLDHMEAAAKFRPTIEDPFTDINNFGDAGMFAVGAISENLPQLVGSLGFGAIGATAAKVAATRMVGNMVRNRILAGVGKDLAEKEVANLVGSTIKKGVGKNIINNFTEAGAFAGGMVPNTVMESGSIGGEIYDRTGQVRPDIALPVGVVAGALETVGEGIQALPFLKIAEGAGVAPILSKKFVADASKGVAGSVVGEGVTEFLQTGVEQGGVAMADPTYSLSSPEASRERQIAALTGAVAGGGVNTVINTTLSLAEQIRRSGSPATAAALEKKAAEAAIKAKFPITVDGGKKTDIPTAEEVLNEADEETDEPAAAPPTVVPPTTTVEPPASEPTVVIPPAEDAGKVGDAPKPVEEDLTPEEEPPAVAPTQVSLANLEGIDAYEAIQELIDQREAQLESDGVDVNQLYSPYQQDAKALEDDGWTQMPDDLAELYRQKASIGGGATEESEAPVSTLPKPDSFQLTEDANGNQIPKIATKLDDGTDRLDDVFTGDPMHVAAQINAGIRVPFSTEQEEELGDAFSVFDYNPTAEGGEITSVEVPGLGLVDGPGALDRLKQAAATDRAKKGFDQSALKKAKEAAVRSGADPDLVTEVTDSNIEDQKPRQLEPGWVEANLQGNPVAGENDALEKANSQIDKYFNLSDVDTIAKFVPNRVIESLGGDDPLRLSQVREDLKTAALLEYQKQIRAKGSAAPVNASTIARSVLVDYSRKIGRRIDAGYTTATRGNEEDFAETAAANDSIPDIETALDMLEAGKDKLDPYQQLKVDVLIERHESGEEIDENELSDLLEKIRPQARGPGTTQQPGGKPLPPAAGVREEATGARLVGTDVSRADGGSVGGSTPKATGATEALSASPRQVVGAVAPVQRDTSVGTRSGSSNAPSDGGRDSQPIAQSAGVRPGAIVVGADLLPQSRDRVGVSTYTSGSGFQLGEDQVQDVNLALANFLDNDNAGFMLANGTGLGKTAEQIAIADQYLKETKRPVLIVTANRQILDNFRSDAASMGINLRQFDLRTYSDITSGKYRQDGYGLVIFDEAHLLKNADTSRAKAADSIPTTHTLFSTATPMDKPTAAVYFLSKLFKGSTESSLLAQIGVRYESRKDETGKVAEVPVLQKGATWETVVQELIKLRDQAISSGALVRRYFPFYGDIAVNENRLTEDQLDEQSEIDQFYESQIEAASYFEKRNLSGQRTQELSRWAETVKAKWAYDRIKQELAAGRNPILVAETSGPQTIRGLGVVRNGLIGQVADLLAADGIQFASIYGSKDKTKEVAKFKNGKVRVVLATPQSGGTGINLDDTVGTAPRTMLVATVNFSGDVFDQILGRVSRRTTASPAKVEFLTYRDSIGDQRRAEVTDKKLSILRAVQGGTDADATMLRGSVDSPASRIRSGSARSAGSLVEADSALSEVSVPRAKALLAAAAKLLPPGIRFKFDSDPNEESAAWVDYSEGVPNAISIHPELLAYELSGIPAKSHERFVQAIVLEEAAHIEDIRKQVAQIEEMLGRKLPPEGVSIAYNWDAETRAEELRATPEGAALLDQAKASYSQEAPGEVSDAIAYSELKRMIAQEILIGDTSEGVFRKAIATGNSGLIQWIRDLINKVRTLFRRGAVSLDIKSAIDAAEERLFKAMGEIAVSSGSTASNITRVNASRKKTTIIRKVVNGSYTARGIFSASNKFNDETFNLIQQLTSKQNAEAVRAKGASKDLEVALKEEFVKTKTPIPTDTLNVALGNLGNAMTELQQEEYKKLMRVDEATAQGFRLTAIADNRAQYKLDQAAALASLPPKTQAAVKSMRDALNHLSQRIKDEGGVSPDLEAVIGDNMGVYLHRSYRIFDDTEWVDYVREGKTPEAQKIRTDSLAFAKNVAIGYRAAEIRTAMRVAGTPVSKADALVLAAADPTINQRATNVFNDWLRVGDEGFMAFANGKIPGQKNLSLLKLRGNIPEVLRKLWGQYDDPVTNFAKTYGNMAGYMANHEFLSDLKETGVREGWIYDPSMGGTLPVDYVSLVGDSTRKSLAPLAGVYGPQLLRDALQEWSTPQETTNPAIRFFIGATGLSMAMKTVGSVQSVTRNFLGNIVPTIANGNFTLFSDPRGLLERMGVATKSTAGRGLRWVGDMKAWREKYAEYVELGIAQDGSMAQLFREMRELSIGDVEDNLLKKSIGGVAKFAEGVYQGVDDFWKIINYESELAKYEKALAGATDAEIEAHASRLGIDLNGANNKVKALAAGVVRDTIFTYSKAPEIIRQLRRVPVIAPFVTFTAEVIRTLPNIARIGYLEMTSSVPAMRKIGAQRLLGLSVAFSLPVVLTAVSGALSGFDDDEDKAIRRFVPEWQKNAQLLVFRKAQGEVGYADLSFFDPYQFFKEPVIAAMRVASNQKQTGEFDITPIVSSVANSIAGPFVGEQILSSALIDVARNQTASGKAVYNPYSRNAWQDISLHLLKPFVPGTVDSMERIYKASIGYAEQSSGRKYDLGIELAAPFVGVRPSSLDVQNALSYSAVRFQKDFQQATQVFSKLARARGTVGPTELRKGYEDANLGTHKVFQDLRLDYLSALKLGVPAQKAAEILRAGGLTVKNLNAVQTGNYEKYTASKQLQELMSERDPNRNDVYQRAYQDAD